MTAAHPLDRPAWQALTTGQAALARGDHRALRFDPGYSPFAAAADDTPGNVAALAALIAPDEEMWLIEGSEVPAPPGTVIVRQAPCVQMLATRIAPRPLSFEVVALAETDAPAMRALAALTAPGPFLARTNRLGDFIGVKEQGRLVAMAGERMKPTGFSEVSGVCTHPAFRGRGYAGGLMAVVAQHILDRGEVPFLHAYADNAGAIALYERLGFRTRATVIATVLRKG